MDRFVSCFFFTARRSTRGRMVIPCQHKERGGKLMYAYRWSYLNPKDTASFIQTMQCNMFVCVYMSMKIGTEKDFLVPILITKKKKVKSNPLDPWKNCKSWQGNNYIYTQWAVPPVLQHWAVIHSMSSLVHTMIFLYYAEQWKTGQWLQHLLHCSGGFFSRSDAGRDQATPHAAIANAPSHLTLQTVSSFHFLWKAYSMQREKKDCHPYAAVWVTALHWINKINNTIK